MASVTATGPRVVWARRSGDGSLAVWIISVAMAAATLALCAPMIGALASPGPVRVQWWIIAPLFYLTERHLVRVHFRGHEHSFSLGEIPLVLGLFFLPPAALVLAQFAGSLAALVLHRREKVRRAAFNIAHFCLEATLAGLIFHALVGRGNPMGPMGRAAALTAVTSTTIAGALAVWLAIAVTGGAPRWRRFVQLLGFGIVVAVTNGSLGLLAVSVLWTSPESAWLLVVPTAILFFAYRLYTSEREKKVRLEFLYRSTRTLQRSSGSAPDLPALLSSIRDTFGADCAEITLLPSAPGERVVRTVLGPEGEARVVGELEGDVTQSLWPRLLEDPSAVGATQGQQVGFERHLSGRRFRGAMIVPLSGEQGVIGAMLVGNRAGEADDFDAADLKLFETLANHVGASLEGAALSASLQRSEERFRSLVQNSSDVTTVIEPDTTIKYQTPSVERVLGYEPSALIGTKLIDLVHPEDAARVAAWCRRTSKRHSSSSVAEWRMRRKDGSYVYAETMSSDLLANDAVRGIVLTSRDVTERKVLEDQLRHQAFHDTLTDLANRALFTDRVDHALARKSGSHAPAVIFADLDDFKAINDSLGHSAGDDLLRAVGHRLRGCIRSEDTAARLGGDEFGILLEATSDEAEALEVAERIVSAIAEPYAIDGQEVIVGASVGIAHGSSSTGEAGDLLRNADVAMYMAKGRGKSGCEVFDPSAHRAMRDRFVLKSDLQRAVTRKEFTLRYQPILALDTGEVSGMEALIRWERPQHGIVSPADFIPLAEETGLIVPLGCWVLEEACRRLASWQEERPDAPLSISVNLSGRQLQHPDIIEHVETALKMSGVAPSSLTLEITESVLMEDTNKILNKLRALKSLGVQLAIDDFGTGYSSLSYLHQFPFDTLKIDKAFIGRHGDGHDESPLAQAIVELARTLGLRTVAEGIETREQLVKLQGLRCQLGQGYLFAAPLEADSAEAFLATPSLIERETRELQPLG